MVILLDNPVCWPLNAFALAAGAPARFGEALSPAKDIAVGQTPGGYDKELLALWHYRTGNVGKMGIYLLFHDTQHL